MRGTLRTGGMLMSNKFMMFLLFLFLGAAKEEMGTSRTEIPS